MSINFLYDKQIRRYCFFMAGMILLLSLSGLWLVVVQTNMVQEAFLEHENAIVSSLLDQGVSRETISTAVSNTKSSDAGSDFLTAIGRTAKTAPELLHFTATFGRTTGEMLLAAGICFSLLLLIGTYLFLHDRERLYRQANGVIQRFIEGDYSEHLPRMDEGDFYQLCSSIDQLATMLKSRNESEYQTKEFLKATISDISHQLKTPLAALSMYREIIENEPDNAETVKEFAVKMGNSLGRMEQLIKSMLKITRLDVGTITFEKESCKISDLVMQAVSELTTRADHEKKKILLDGARTDTLICDVEWTSEAVGNIVKNALDHTKEGGTIRISWECSPFMTRIRIADNGHGIAQEDIHHIFKRFYRSSDSPDGQGIGLGLPLAKSIVEGQGGTISVKSDPGEGTVFTISLLSKL